MKDSQITKSFLLRIPYWIILILMLLGCSNTTKSVPESQETSLNQEQQTLDMEHYSEEDPIATFKKNKDYRNFKITDYILVDDNKLPMLKAVISFYDKVANNSCNIAFIYGDTIHRINFSVNELDGVKTYEIANSSRLVYAGDGAVTTSIRNVETNEIMDYKITFSYDASTSTTNFEVESEKQTK
ncbi:hypothetical protein [Ureibacillus acetophenoni]|uniref:Lipoprotein n=1 Tax=Ureibacillus acetophenoni TaxID=614649 RepID=A0A285ULC8_9BACL|nr:hypothetical protein [Ureibacillus acetophenoni]SOC42705.1 hypothetical protein SAMN05877842_11392 [Ureibacillus acetophenoni]